MIKILLPNNYQEERKYIHEVILDEWLGLPIEVIFVENVLFTEIILENGKKIKIEDHFFNSFTKENSYLNLNNIPQSIEWVKKKDNPFLAESDLPIIFGNSRLDITSTGADCGADIFASAFFMLTRWEEYVFPVRDLHNRFPYTASLAHRFSFHHRPIVNEYVEFLWNLLCFLGYEGNRLKQKFEAIITHDVDIPLQWRSPFSLIKKLGGDILKRHSSTLAFQSILSYKNTLNGKSKDPFDTFDYLMGVSEAHNLKSRFYFLTSGKTSFDKWHLPSDHPFIKNIFHKINQRGHQIGFHPSYDTYNNSYLFKKELENLQGQSPQKITQGRQHFLRFAAPKTWELWEENGMKEDLTLYYPESPGFRAGTCTPFSVFNFLSKKKLHLKEVPLSFMEGSFLTYLMMQPNEMLQTAEQIISTVKKYKGSFVLLWHNSSFCTPNWNSYASHYTDIIGMLACE